jgi:hypothetical protein
MIGVVIAATYINIMTEDDLMYDYDVHYLVLDRPNALRFATEMSINDQNIKDIVGILKSSLTSSYQYCISHANEIKNVDDVTTFKNDAESGYKTTLINLSNIDLTSMTTEEKAYVVYCYLKFSALKFYPQTWFMDNDLLFSIQAQNNHPELYNAINCRNSDLNSDFLEELEFGNLNEYGIESARYRTYYCVKPGVGRIKNVGIPSEQVAGDYSSYHALINSVGQHTIVAVY